jgi:hypothetical protein
MWFAGRARAVFALLAVALWGSLAPSRLLAADDWTSFDISGVAFQLPGEPKKDELGNYLLELDGGNTVFLVNVTAFKENVEADAAQRLNALRDAEAKSWKGKVTDEREVAYEGHPGRAFTVQAPDEMEYRVRAYLVGQRLIQMVAARGPESQTSPAAVSKFFNSLKVPQPEPATPTPNNSNGGKVVAEFGFSVEMPTPPEQPKPHQYTSTTDNGNTVYKVVLVQGTENLEADAAARLDRVRDAEVEAIKGKVQTEKDVTLAGHPGRAFTIQVSGEGELEIRFRVYVVGTRMCELIVLTTPDSQAGPADVNRFFNSLKITGEPQANNGGQPTPLAPRGNDNKIKPQPANPALGGTSPSGKLLGMKLEAAKQKDLFTYFHLEETDTTGNAQAGVITFKPHARRFNPLVTLRVTTNAAGQIQGMELALSRAFIDGASGVYARDIAKSFLTSVIPDDDLAQVPDLANEIQYGATGPAVEFEGRPKLPEKPTHAYRAFLGRVEKHEQELGQTKLSLRNVEQQDEELFVISVSSR